MKQSSRATIPDSIGAQTQPPIKVAGKDVRDKSEAQLLILSCVMLLRERRENEVLMLVDQAYRQPGMGQPALAFAAALAAARKGRLSNAWRWARRACRMEPLIQEEFLANPEFEEVRRRYVGDLQVPPSAVSPPSNPQGYS